MDVSSARRVVEAALAGLVFPAAAVAVGSTREVLWREAFGALTFDAGAPAATSDTPFDLASLTKAIATTSLAMQHVQSGTMALDEPLSLCFADWHGADRERATVRDLLEHTAGLPARMVDAPPQTRREFEQAICRLALEYAPRSQSIYSDLGFILLGFLVAARGGAPLSEQFDRLIDPLLPTVQCAVGEAAWLTFDLPLATRRAAAPTLPLHDDHRDHRRGRMLVGEVHDNYAAALGGDAGHAGLFGTVSGVAAFARAVLGAARGDSDAPSPFTPDAVAVFTTRSHVAGSSRALGWDMMLPTSSCGTAMSSSAFGHVGFTGTSLWIDPLRDRYFVLLTNRVCGGGTLDQMRTVRRALHDALADL
ncbi:MAG: class A beta-lactamase-related serine hydrolase [Acidobacteria bacterium]|nr:class A beta-lactamase-related serine hydrolase [Acidobacteriota bacterium]